MSKSGRLRAEDWRSLMRLVGECRDLGDDPEGWRRHALDGLRRLAGAEIGHFGEVAVAPGRVPELLGTTDRGIDEGFDREAQREAFERVERDRSVYGLILDSLGRLASSDHATHARTELMGDRDWYRSTSYELVHRPRGIDHILLCHRATSCGSFSNVLLERAEGAADFTPRARAIAHESHAALAPLIGGPLARFSDPSPAHLPARVRRALALLLEGDSDKRIAARLGISVHTVNEYSKIAYRHFGVNSRPELLARWARRGRGTPPPWAD